MVICFSIWNGLLISQAFLKQTTCIRNDGMKSTDAFKFYKKRRRKDLVNNKFNDNKSIQILRIGLVDYLHKTVTL